MIKSLRQPVFVAFLLISFVLWYTNKLSHTYTVNVVIPIKIENSFASQYWIDNGELSLLCRIQASGYKLLQYRFGLEPEVVVPSSMLEMSRTDSLTYDYSIDIPSLKRAIDNSISSFILLSVQEPSVHIDVIPMAERKIPVKAALSLSYERQYMQIGRVQLDPAEVSVKAPKNIIDTISMIYTYPQTVTNIHTNMRNRADLVPIEGVVMSPERIYYNVYCGEFTEVNTEQYIEVRNVPDSLKSFVVPSQVSMRLHVVISEYDRIMRNPLRAYVDYRDRTENLTDKFMIRIDSLPETVKIEAMDPQYVNLYFEKQR